MRIHHLALQVSDCERSLAFYAGVLGLPERARQTDDQGRLRAIWVAADDVVLMLERSLRGRSTPGGSGHVLCFAVSDLPEWERKLRAAGLTVDDRTASTLYVADPDGHRVGLSVYRF
jgi:catechol 2,3-dioxygenase-like lactoylglutathione lyase family enzyme